LSHAFCDGQVYTALSRAQNSAQLAIHNFTVDKIKANAVAVAFMREMEETAIRLETQEDAQSSGIFVLSLNPYGLLLRITFIFSRSESGKQ